MAIRFTAASSQNLELTSGLPDHNANYTWAGWIYFHTVSGNQMFLDFQSSGHAWQDMDSFTAVGSQWRVESNNGGSITDSYSASSEVASGTWYYVACVRESSTSLKLYVNGVQKCNATGSTASRAACAYVNFGAYYTGSAFGEHCNAKFYGWKAWARALTLAELSREMRQAMPTDASSLYGVWPFLADSSRATDFSGRGHTWTEYNSPTDEDPPPIAWGGDPDPIQFVTVAGGGPSTNTIIPDPGSLTLTGFAPALHTMIPPVPGTLSLTGFVPVLHTALHPAAGALAVTGNAPNIVTDAVLSPDPGALTLTGNTPILGGEQVLQPTPGALTLTGVAPNIVTHTRLSPTPGSLTLTGHAPYAGPPVTFPPNSDINLSGFGLFLRRKMRRQRTV